jgi:hypothetical protein
MLVDLGLRDASDAGSAAAASSADTDPRIRNVDATSIDDFAGHSGSNAPSGPLH